MRNLAYIIILAACAAISCEKNIGKKHDLAFEKNSYVITSAGSYYISILGGNGKYTISSSDESVATVSWHSSGTTFGSLEINPVKSGQTSIEVTDNATGQHTILQLKVVKAYMNICPSFYGAAADIPAETDKTEIIKRVADIPLFHDGHIYTLIADAGHNLRIYASEADYATNTPLYTGTYLFEYVGGEYYVNFEYDKEGVSIPEKYILKKGYGSYPQFDGALRSMISNVFGLDWTEDGGRSHITEKPRLLLCKDYTADFKGSYPDLRSVVAAYSAIPLFPAVPDLPLSLLE